MIFVICPITIAQQGTD